MVATRKGRAGMKIAPAFRADQCTISEGVLPSLTLVHLSADDYEDKTTLSIVGC